MANPSRLTATASDFRQCGLCLVERQTFREDRVVTSIQQGDQARLQWHALLVRKVGRVAGATQQALHLARPVFFPDLDQRLEFAQIASVA